MTRIDVTLVPAQGKHMQAVQEQLFWEAVKNRDLRMDGQFVYAVISTGIFCRPGCPSRRPRRERVRFFQSCEAASQAGFQPCRRCRPLEPRPRDMEQVCRYIEEHLDRPLSLEELSGVAGLSPFHLQRKFKAALGITPREYAESCRLNKFKSATRAGVSITDAIYDAGFGSNSRLYERSGSQLGMTPRAYRNGGAAMEINYATELTPIGIVLIAATSTGVCSIQFGDTDEELEQGLRAEFPKAHLRRDELMLQPYAEELLTWLKGQKVSLDLPLDIRATAFQKLVWKYLQSIPYGATRSYSEIARDLGAPNATRAVARACATNPVALAIPCHRVIKTDGALAGYRWGLDRKKKLLEMEAHQQ